MAEADLDSQLAALRGISTATLTMVLLKQGLRNVWLRGAMPLLPGQGRVAGPAFTLRFIPMREDLATPASLASGRSTRVAIEEMPAGCVVVIDAQGTVDAGSIGDILAARMQVRGVVGVVTDGVVRDIVGIESVGLPVWGRGTAAPPSITAMHFAGWQDPVSCGGVAIFPGDVIVADADGAVVVPQAMVGDVIQAGQDQERLEAWILEEVKRGVPLLGLYPASPETLARYAAESASARA